MLISVIVPIFNVEKYLDECIQSILSQTYSQIEVILVDDGSTDSSLKICKEYSFDKRVVIVHQKNCGLVSARKAGFLASSGDYITFVDGDDFISETRIASFAESIKKYFPDIVCCGLQFFENNHPTKALKNTIDAGFYDKENMSNFILNRAISNPPFFNFGITPNLVSKCIKRSLYAKHFIIDESITLGEDFAITFPCLLDANSICLIDDVGYMYRYNSNSITHSYDEKLIERSVLLLSFFAKNNNLKQNNLEKQFNDYACFIIKNIIANELLFSKKPFKQKKARLNNALENPYFSTALKSTSFVSIKDKVVYYLLSHKCFWLLSLLLNIKKQLNKM